MTETGAAVPLVVVEGPLCVVWLHQRGWTNAVSTFSASLSPEQAALLLQTKREPLVLVFDADEAGQSGMRKGAAKLIKTRPTRVVEMPAGKSPDE